MMKSTNSCYSAQKTISTIISVAASVVLLSGCQIFEKQTSTLAQEQKNQASEQQTIPSVDVAVVSEANLGTTQEYIGTTQPATELSVRAQVSGTLISLSVEVGDRVRKGQILGQIDDSILLAVVNQEKAELANLESELTRARIEVKNAEIKVEEALINLQQAGSDQERYKNLAEQGLISQREAESYVTAAKVAQKTLLLAQESVNIAKQAVTSAISRVSAQKSVIAESIQRQAHTQLIAETTGIVIRKISEKGNLVREGEEILKIGDFDPIKVVVLLSELDLADVAIGKTVEVKLDAFPKSRFLGHIKNIAPVANIATRQVPLEILIPNPDNKVKGGLLARINFSSSLAPQVTISEFAVIRENNKNYVFVVSQANSDMREGVVTRRQVNLGSKINQKVAITRGLKSGEKIVLRSTRPLNDGETVGLSIISQ